MTKTTTRASFDPGDLYHFSFQNRLNRGSRSGNTLIKRSSSVPYLKRIFKHGQFARRSVTLSINFGMVKLPVRIQTLYGDSCDSQVQLISIIRYIYEYQIKISSKRQSIQTNNFRTLFLHTIACIILPDVWSNIHILII